MGSLVACQDKSNAVDDNVPLSPTATQKHNISIEDQQIPTMRRKSTISNSVKSVQFCSNLFKSVMDSNHQFQDNKRNIIISPFSILTAMTICMCGSNGNTLKEMLQVLYPQDNQSDDFENVVSITQNTVNLCRFFNENYNGNSDNGKGVMIKCANKIYIDHAYKITAKFVKSSGIHLVESIDLSNTKKSVKIINSWCSKNTQNKIEQIVRSDHLVHCKLVIINVVYFSGKFDEPFNKSQTKHDIPFYSDSTQSTQINKVSMMHSQKVSHYFVQNFNGFDVVRLDFSASRISLYLALQKDTNNDKKDKSESMVFSTKDILSIDDWEYRRLNLFVPKFKFEYNSELSPVLCGMGIRDAFDAKADLSVMTGSTDLYIDKVIHKAMIEVDEKGCEAAAITADIGQGKGIRASQIHQEVPTIRFDHPFDFIVYDRKKKATLFSGRYYGL